MDDEHAIGTDAMPEVAADDEDGYRLEADETGNLDEAMREALEAVERSEAQLESAAEEAAARGEDLVAAGGDFSRLQEELADLRDRSVRTLADFDNYRKRVARERREELRYAALDLARDMLSVVDNLERALTAEGNTEDLKQGVVLIHRQLEETLRRHGVQRVSAQGELFDPAVHEAVARHEEADLEEPVVSEELQSGYLLHERLLRPAMVKVAVPAADARAEGEEEEPQED